MARQLRILYPGALYHITVRGNQKKNIFDTDYDMSCLLSILSKIVESRNIICHAYCLMPNHFHLLIETPEANISFAMRDINSIYTQQYNKVHGTVGHLFQGRYKSFLIEKESYLLEVARYTVLNPVRAGLVKRPEDWKWSSYKATAGIVRAPKWLNTSWTLRFFDSENENARRNYKQFVHEGINRESPFINISESKILGSQQFISSFSDVAGCIHDIENIPVKERIIGRPALSDIFADITDVDERNEAVRFAKYNCGYLASEIARHLKLSQSNISLVSKNCRLKT